MTTMTSGHVPVGDLRMYFEVHGDERAGTPPLLLLHGGLFDIDQQFGPLIPGLSAGRRVVGVDFQGHGRTNDIDRPLTIPDLTADSPGISAANCCSMSNSPPCSRSSGVPPSP